jgi:hypothetical protein
MDLAEPSGGIPGTGLPAGVRPGALWRIAQVPPEFRTKSIAEARVALEQELVRVRAALENELEAWVTWRAAEPLVADPRDAEQRLDRSARDARQYVAVIAVHEPDIAEQDESIFRARMAAFIRRRVPEVLGWDDGSCGRVQAAVLDAHVVGDDVLEAINGRAGA